MLRIQFGLQCTSIQDGAKMSDRAQVTA